MNPADATQHDEKRDEDLESESSSSSSSSDESEPENATEVRRPEIATEVMRQTDIIPINNDIALLKEEVITSYYFGAANVSAGDFINAGLDTILSTQLQHSTSEQAQNQVYGFLANYVNWAVVARFHSVKARNKVSA